MEQIFIFLAFITPFEGAVKTLSLRATAAASFRQTTIATITLQTFIQLLSKCFHKFTLARVSPLSLIVRLQSSNALQKFPASHSAEAEKKTTQAENVQIGFL